jgi:hypothetical protein
MNSSESDPSNPPQSVQPSKVPLGTVDAEKLIDSWGVDPKVDTPPFCGATNRDRNAEPQRYCESPLVRMSVHGARHIFLDDAEF